MNPHVLLLHGIWMPGVSMHWLARRLRGAGFAPEVFAYPSVVGGPRIAVPRLIERLRDGGGPHVVAHSLGGLIALRALCERPELPVARVVCLGTPLAGSAAAASLARWRTLSRWMGRSADLLRGGCTEWPASVEVGMIAGDVPRGLGALFARFDGAHDGTVAVAETQVPGLADHVVVAASHSGLAISAQAARCAAAFLRNGRFPHAEPASAP